jgi:hypothetical protein
MHFEATLKQPTKNIIELNGISFYAGFSHWKLAQGQKDMAWHLQQSIAFYDKALVFFTEKDFPVQWALIQNNLSNAYCELDTGDRNENLEMAIATCKAALESLLKRNSQQTGP